MKANEIMVGNYLQDDTGRIGRVIEFKEGYIKLKMQYSTIAIHSKSGITDIDAKPIPLIPEILEKFGFKLSDGNRYYYFYIKDDLICHIHVDNSKDCFVSYKQATIDFHILYLHQIQNLYFALTGEELDWEM